MTHTYQIEGMTCNSCEVKVKSELLKLPDVLSAEVNKETSEAVIQMQKHISLAELQNAIKQAGEKYTIKELKIGGVQAHKQNGKSIHPSEGMGIAGKTKLEGEENRTWLETYKPIVLLFGFISTVSLVLSISANGFNWMLAMRVFMSGFFLSFSFFKLLDLNGFVDSYSTYDIVAKRWRAWGYVYVFTELSLGILYAMNFEPVATNMITLVVMSVSIVGVLQSVLNKTKIQCACLGTVFKLPMSTVTIIEDGLMIVMSAVMLAGMM